MALHIALLLIVAGAVTTSLSARKGMIHLRCGESVASFNDSRKGRQQLPFELSLDDFTVSYYPGTDTPSDYISTVSIIEDGVSIRSSSVSMNHILSYRGYRICQSSYDSDVRGSTFSVSYDPAGITIVYSGYAVFLLAFLLFFFTDKKFRCCARKVAGTVAAAVLLLGTGSMTAGAAEMNTLPTIPKEEAEQFGKLYVFYHGRVCPLQSMAKDFRTKLYGNADMGGLSDEQVLIGWMFYGSSWMDVPQKQRRGVNDARDREQTVNALFTGELLRLYPLADTLGHISWYSQNDRLPDSISNEEWLFVKKSMNYIGELVISGDYEELDYSLSKIVKFQQKNAGATLPSSFRMCSERLLNSFPPLFPVAGLWLVVGLVFLGWFIVCIARGREIDVRWRLSAVVLEAVLFMFLSFMLVLMWIVGGHVPLSNGAETMASIAWTVLLGGLVAGRRFQLMQPFALVVSALALLVCAMSEANPSVTLLVPVLQSPLLSIHVSLMMLSYAILAVIAMNSIAGLCLAGKKTAAVCLRLADISMFLLYFGVFFLAAGIITGSVWANISWGSYWSWDPKETWALITLLIYSLAVHRSHLKPLRTPISLHVFLLLSFISVLFTYFGVNLLLGGLHSYAG